MHLATAVTRAWVDRVGENLVRVTQDRCATSRQRYPQPSMQA
jgi:hypothetical protein